MAMVCQVDSYIAITLIDLSSNKVVLRVETRTNTGTQNHFAAFCAFNRLWARQTHYQRASASALAA
jgi:hypothetical protein